MSTISRDEFDAEMAEWKAQEEEYRRMTRTVQREHREGLIKLDNSMRDLIRQTNDLAAVSKIQGLSIAKLWDEKS